MNEKIRILRTEILSDDWYVLKKVVYEIRTENEQILQQSREAYDRGNGATILLYNPDKKTVILTRQFRAPTYINGNPDGMLIEAPAGLLDGDDPDTCIRKETEEETGYRIGEVKKIFELYMSPGAVTELLHLYVAAYDDKQKISDGGGKKEEEEDIEVMELGFDDAIRMVQTGEIRDAKTVILLQYAKLNHLVSAY
jgi:nudix-type nucleoside diphosphatase (YffH/AdpP family)